MNWYLSLVVIAFCNSVLRIYYVRKSKQPEKDRCDAKKPNNEAAEKLRKCIERSIIFPDLEENTELQYFGQTLKYLVNYSFQEFGAEVFVVVVLVNCCINSDYTSAVYLLLLIPFIVAERKKLAVTVVFQVMTSLFLLMKYMMLLWLPPNESLCGGEDQFRFLKYGS
ncbi:MAG: hypothetical protein AAF901_13550, partial [Bacteroidota bacterium]